MKNLQFSPIGCTRNAKQENQLRIPKLLLLAAGLFAFLPLNASAIVDVSPADGLDDVWQAKFGAQALAPGGDEDGDGCTNLEECVAGTDPYDGEDCHVVSEFSTTGVGDASVDFETVDGKCYQVQVSSTLGAGAFVDYGNELYGTGSMVHLDLSMAAAGEVTGNVNNEVWANIGGHTVADLTGDGRFPDSPSGTEGLGKLQIAANVDDNYGGRIRGYIKPPATGAYKFYLSSRSHSQFFLSTSDNPAGATLTASVSNEAVAPEQWDAFGEQASPNLILTGGEKYYFEVLHAHGGDADHCAVGWTGPGLPSGVQVIDGDYLCPFDGGTVAPDATDQVVYYGFEDGSGTTAADGIGGDNDGTLVADAAFVAGFSGGAVQLDGTGDQVNIVDSNDINLVTHELRTVALWFKADDPNAAAKQVIYEEGGGTNGLNIYLEGGVLYVGAWVGGLGGTDPEDFILHHDTPLTDTGWHHVAFVLNATGATVPVADAFKGYLDGVEFGSGAASQMLGHGGDIAIGAERQDTYYDDGPGSTDGNHFAGCVDEFALWNRALSPSEISSLASPASGDPAPLSVASGFLRVRVKDIDSDGDGISDYAEKLMAGEGNFSPFDANSTTSGLDDITTVTNALGASSETVDIVAVDTEAFEDPRDDAGVTAGTPVNRSNPDCARFRIKRVGTLNELTVAVNFNAGAPESVTDTVALAADYNATTAGGAPVSTSVTLPFGAVSADIIIHPVDDSATAEPHEYPETVRCNVGAGSYTVGTSTDIAKIYDARDIPSQETLFVAYGVPEPGALNPQGSAAAFGVMKGSKDMMVLNTAIYSPFSSGQDDSHIHKAQPGPNNGGAIIFEIVQTGTNDPLLGELTDYEYPLDESAPVTPRVAIDSLYFQNGETPLYLNWHTATNSGGELWALFTQATGSIDPPVHPPMDPITLLDPVADEAALDRDIYRFLNQATFGAVQEDFDALKATIVAEKALDSNYSRVEAYSDWIDNQIDVLDQTYLLDYLLAVNNQEFVLRDYFNPAEWYDRAWFPYDPADPGNTNPNLNPGPTPPLGTYALNDIYETGNPAQADWQLRIIPVAGGWPSGTDPAAPLVMPTPAMRGMNWPTVDRNATPGDPLQFRFTDDFPIRDSHVAWGDDNDNDDSNPGIYPTQRHNGNNFINNSYNKWATDRLGRPNDRNKYAIHWNMHVNAHDQLRQKMGFALQQIDVVANTLTVIQDRDKGMANYQDQINRMAFGKYRDIIDFIMHSPQMGYWLSSIKNQKEADISSPPDGIIDVFPDENLAREVMQLFTCGLFLLHSDGSLALAPDGGLPQPTYDNDDITELSRIITGHSFGKYSSGGNSYLNFDTPLENNNFNRGNGNARSDNTFNYPMKMFGRYHDVLPKTILGGKVIDNSGLADGTGTGNDVNPSWDDETLVGNLDMKQALDWLAGIPGDGQPDFDQTNSHQSTAPFIANRLIKRFTTSNPSQAYVDRVTRAFRDGYDGDQDGNPDVAGTGEGDLRSAIKQILLDYEARDPGARGPSNGLKKSPYEAYVHLLRGFDAHSQVPLRPHDLTGAGDFPGHADPEPGTYSGNGDYTSANPDLFLENVGYASTQLDNFRLNCQFMFGNTDSVLSMSPMNQPTVFNFYLPEYSPDGVISASGLTAPELMLANETSLYRNVNYFYQICNSNNGQSVQGLPQANQAFGVTSGNANNNDNVRIDWVNLGNAMYAGLTGSEIEKDTAVFDMIDKRLTGGLFKELYPTIDAGDDDDPLLDGINQFHPNYNDGNLTNDDENMTPREAIINFMGVTYNETNGDRDDKLRWAVYLYTTSPDFLVRQ